MNVQCLIDRLFFSHPRSKGESYWKHFKAAFLLWVKMFYALVALGIHTFIPGFFQTTASQLISTCHNDLSQRCIVMEKEIVLLEEMKLIDSLDHQPSPSLSDHSPSPSLSDHPPSPSLSDHN